VARAEEWPGVHCVTPLLTGAPVGGTWFDRTLEHTTGCGARSSRRKSIGRPISAREGGVREGSPGL